MKKLLHNNNLGVNSAFSIFNDILFQLIFLTNYIRVLNQNIYIR